MGLTGSASNLNTRTPLISPLAYLLSWFKTRDLELLRRAIDAETFSILGSFRFISNAAVSITAF